MFHTTTGKGGLPIYRLYPFSPGHSTLDPSHTSAIHGVIIPQLKHWLDAGCGLFVFITGLHSTSGNVESAAYVAGMRAIVVKYYMMAFLKELPERRFIARSSAGGSAIVDPFGVSSSLTLEAVEIRFQISHVDTHGGGI